VNNPTAAASSAGGSIDPGTADGINALRTGLELARASQLTMLRLQLALHKSNRRTAMQALDNLLDIDAEMEGLTTSLGRLPAPLRDDAALSGFIGLQRTAIAAEKHGLTGGDLRADTRPIGIVAPGDPADTLDPPAQPLLSDDEAESEGRTGSRRWWPALLAIAIALILAGAGLAAYLWPALPLAWIASWGF